MNVGEDALTACFLEMSMLEDAHDGLQGENGAHDEEADDHVGRYSVVEVAQVMSESDTESHGADHHDRGKHLDGDVYRHDLLLQIRVFQVRNVLDRQVDRDGTERVKDDEYDRHYAGMGISFSVEDLVRVKISFLVDVPGIT